MRGKPTAELSPYECGVHAVHTVISVEPTAEDFQRARACLDATVKRDPTYPAAWAELAFVLTNQRWSGLGLPASEAEDIDKRTYLNPRVAEAGQRAVNLAPNKAWAHLALFVGYYATCQPDRMRVEADRVLGLDPDNAYFLGPMGVDLAFAGQWDYGRKLAERALALVGPSAPAWWWYAVSKDYYHKGDYTKAYEYFLHSYSEASWEDLLHVIYTLPYLGRTDEARARIPELLKLKPNISVQENDRLYGILCFEADYREKMAKALRMAGLRETSDETLPPKTEAPTRSSNP